MEKKRLEIIITALLALVFVFAWANTFKALKKKGQEKAPSAPLVSPVVETPPLVEEEDKDEKMKWGRDPFSGKAYSSPEANSSDLRCSGIIWDKDAPLAMINDRVVRTGERISGNTVKEIKPDRVVLNDGSRDFELKLE